ncbi:MAG: NTP transferase domain-containing protein [Desulfovibrionaceae bacterium]
MPKTLSIIPARGGSKGLPRKNVLPFCGKPLIAHTIEASLACTYIDDTIVSTEDAEIRAVSEQYGAEVVARPPQLATDEAEVHDAVLNLIASLEKQGRKYDYIVLLQPTSPLRTARHLNESFEAFVESGAASLVGVTHSEHHPYKSVVIEDRFLTPLFDARSMESRRQDLPETYRITGAIYIVKTEDFVRERSFFITPTCPYVMSAHASVDIDTDLDMAFAELIRSRG